MAVQRNGWTLLAHSQVQSQLERFYQEVKRLRDKHPKEYKQKKAAKLLAAILDLALKRIPEDPTREVYLQGNTLGKTARHWRRAKFFQQYRLFFRFDTRAKIIIYAWVNDQATLRAYGSKTDAYKVFGQMIEAGCLPNSWKELMAESVLLKEEP